VSAPAHARFVLEVPPAREYVRTSRIFGASIARHFRCDEESVEDLKLALSEAVSRACSEAGEAPQAPVRLVAEVTAGRLSFRIESETPLPGKAELPAEAWDLPEDELSAEVAEGLIWALFPDATFTRAGEGTSVIQFSLPLGGEEASGPEPAPRAAPDV
jgi:anti-sigma regulatory factor (Ser/Thr protein kinase)